MKLQALIYENQNPAMLTAAKAGLAAIGFEESDTRNGTLNAVCVFINSNNERRYGEFHTRSFIGEAYERGGTACRPLFIGDAQLAKFLNTAKEFFDKNHSVTIKLNDEYSANIVTEKGKKVAKVGCQTFTYKAIEALYEAMRE